MSLFRRMGEKFEETKQVFEEAREDPEFHCTACDETVMERYDTCPYCGEEAVEPIESE